MCQLCEKKPVYEFTNKRKLCSRCFINWFHKKVLYTIRKFKMIKRGDVIAYENKSDYKSVVLENVLKMYSEKGEVNILKLSANLFSQVNKNKLTKNPSINKIHSTKNFPINHLNKSVSDSEHKLWEGGRDSVSGSRVGWERFIKQNKIKIAIPSTTDSEANEIAHILIQDKSSKLKQHSPMVRNVIKPLYLFLDKEVLLYAKLKKLNFKEKKKKTDALTNFINELEKKHPEIKRAIISSWLKLNN